MTELRQSGPGGQQNSNYQSEPKSIMDDHPKPFYLFSRNGQSLRQTVLDAKKRPAIGKSRVNVVSIICKDKLKGSVRSELVQALLGSKYKLRSSDDEEQSEDFDTSSDRESLSRLSDLDVSIYETQVTGNLDCDSNLVVLSLSSILEAEKLCQTLKPPEMITNFLFSPDWPLRSQNLIKTLHIMLSVSHAVVFYNPDLSIDHSLVQTLKLLEVLRLKSQTRMTDLLETFEFKKYLPEKWVKQGRLCTPRALFVFGTNNCDFIMKQSDMINAKRNLEDQIYMTLKKTDIICRSDQKPCPISLPERDEFVFILAGRGRAQMSKKNVGDVGGSAVVDGSRNSLESFYTKLIGSLNLTLDDAKTGDRFSSERSFTNARKTKPPNPRNRVNNLPLEDRLEQAYVHSLRQLKKFLLRHLADIRSQTEQHGRQSNVILPTYENLLAVLANLADLFFPIVEDELGLPSAYQSWRKPDERRFVDIYGLLNYEESFSKIYCYQLREVAFAIFSDKLASVSARNQADFSKLLRSTMQYYLINSRGSACLTYRDLLEQDCNNHWQETRNKRGNRMSKNKSFSVSRRPDEIILTTLCDCGQKCSFKMTTKDTKTLDGVYISRLNRTESS